jgi:hypothetical protein
LSSFTAKTLAQIPLLEVIPKLDGHHFRVTAIPEGGFLDFENDSGYLLDMFREIAREANFTYDLLTPSGFGPDCVPRLNLDTPAESYDYSYQAQYNCGTNDVNELQGTQYATDIYLGMYYITPQRQRKNWFTVPFQPPSEGTPVMFGTTTGIPTIEKLIESQKSGRYPPACIQASTATLEFVQDAYPDLEVEPFYGNQQAQHAAMNSGKCPIFIADAPVAAHLILQQSEKGQCEADGRPIGVVGEPMPFGLSHYAIGVGRHVNRTVADTLSFWITVFMADGRLAEFYKGQGGTGKECGYLLNPLEEDLLSNGAITGIVLGAVAFILVPLFIVHRVRLKRQESRFKKRFVQQIARNISIGRRPGSIPAEKLSEEILHIGQGKDFISKADLLKWIHDIKLDFISGNDFDALWNAMDIKSTGIVNPVDFVVFLSACGPEFEKVYEEQSKMPKIERLKLAARRLSIISVSGDQGARDIERRLDGSVRGMQPRSSVSSNTSADLTGIRPSTEMVTSRSLSSTARSVTRIGSIDETSNSECSDS